MPLDLLKRSETGTPLTRQQHDDNFTAIEQEVNSKAPLDSPSFTGAPTAPTPPNGDNSTRLATTAFVANNAAGGGETGVLVQDEGIALATTATTLNFTGAGVAASGTGAVKTINVPGAALTVQDESVPLTTAATTLNFMGAGVTASGTGATKTITIPGAAGGGSGGPYALQRTVAISGNISSADALGLIRVAGDNLALTLISTNFPTLSWVDVVNENIDNGTAARVVTITAAGADNINLSGTTSIQLAPGDAVRIAKIATAAPMWRTLGPIGFLSLAANQFAALNAAGTGLEARTDRVGVVFRAADVGGNGTYPLGFWPFQASKLVSVSIATFAGTCSAQITRNGTAISGFASAVAQTATRTTTASTQAVAEFDYFRVVTTASTGVTGLIVALSADRTA